MLYDRVLNWGLHIRLFQFNESHIPGSPFPFLVGKMGADPALVMASGKGLTEAACGRQARIHSLITSPNVYVKFPHSRAKHLSFLQ